jgi:two-component system sensor histidine kinase KdpD
MVARGRHKIFLGMAPGVGKSYQMLEEAHEERNRGRDVVIGYLEPHDRAETLEQAEGLEVVPRRLVSYRDTTIEEMDLHAILRRRPQLCLIDELAHTNIPGGEHEKRYEDVEAVLAAGVDVYSTVNVQHVHSLASQISRLTGAPVRETVPDRVLDAAEDVVLVDITPELLIERLEAGKIYPGQSAALAQAGFFRPDNLAALREISLLEVAEEVEPHREKQTQHDVSRVQASGRVLLATDRTAHSLQRVLALATPAPRMRPTVYHAFRTAERLHAPFDVLWVQPHGAEDTTNENLAALERLVSTLSGTLIVRRGNDLVKVAAQVARERRSTYLLIGQPAQRTAVENDDLAWPHRDGLIWPHFASVVVGLDVA